MEKKNEILELNFLGWNFEFALELIGYCELLEEKRKYVIVCQLLKSGLSISANVWKLRNAHGRKDFIAKCVIAAKETDETEYWLLLCQKSDQYPTGLLRKIYSIKKLLSKIIASSIKNSGNEKTLK